MSPNAREEDKDCIVASLETIVQALTGNMVETMRSSIDDLREETRNQLNSLRSELLSANESVKRETLGAVETRTNSLAERTDSQLETTRRDLEQRLDETESQLQTAQLSLSERLDGAERSLKVHDAASGRITALLDTMGNVLTRESSPQHEDPSQEAAMSPEPPSPIQVSDPQPDHDGIASEVEVALSDATDRSVIETQPVPVGFGDPTDAEDMEGALDRVDLALSTPPHPHTHD